MMPSKQKRKVLIAYNKPPHRASGSEIDAVSEEAVRGEAEAVFAALTELGHTPEYLPVYHLDEDIRQLKLFQPDIVFNLCEGFRGNARHEMHAAGVWELLGIPYTGNSPLTLGLAQNKVLSKKLFAAQKIPTPAFQVYTARPETTDLKYPLIAKPSREDASLGITQDSVIADFQQLQSVVESLLQKYRQPILVEEFISGREFNLSILGNSPTRVLPVSEIDFSRLAGTEHPVTSYEAKWLPDHPLYQKTPAVCPADISRNLRRQLEDVAVRVYTLLMGRDYGRVDVRVDDSDRIFVLEYNPNPDISPDAGISRSLNAGGITYQRFIEFLLTEAMKRKKNESHTPHEG